MIPAITTFGSEEEWIEASTSWLDEAISEILRTQSSCTVALSGGSTPAQFYENLSKKVGLMQGVYWTLADERYIDPKDENSNQYLVRETLLKHGTVPEDHLIFPDTTKELNDCLNEFESSISERSVDISILGMGGDGHTASLFPPVPEEAFESNQVVLHTTTDAFDVHDRISLSATALSQSKSLVLLKGDEKKQVWEEMAASEEGPKKWPLKGILGEGDGVFLNF